MKTMKKNLSIPMPLHEWYERTAEEMGMHTSSLMMYALNFYMEFVEREERLPVYSGVRSSEKTESE